MSWYHLALINVLGLYFACHLELNRCWSICRGAVQLSKCCSMCVLIEHGSAITPCSSLMLSNLTGSLCRFRMLLIIEVGRVMRLEHRLWIDSEICFPICLIFSMLRAWYRFFHSLFAALIQSGSSWCKCGIGGTWSWQFWLSELISGLRLSGIGSL